jgi:hypothetical protein
MSDSRMWDKEAVGLSLTEKGRDLVGGAHQVIGK